MAREHRTAWRGMEPTATETFSRGSGAESRGRQQRPRSGRRVLGSLHGGRDGVADADRAGDGKKERCEDHGSSTQGRTQITAAGDAQSSPGPAIGGDDRPGVEAQQNPEGKDLARASSLGRRR